VKRSYHENKQRPQRDLAHEQKIGARMRDLRLARGLSLRQVEALGGPCVDTLRLAEAGLISVNVRTLKRLADALSVPAAEFLTEENSDIDEVAAMVYRMNDEQVADLLVKLKRKVVN
jgi:transcriptional regulator with XRE-family HTH domain